MTAQLMGISKQGSDIVNQQLARARGMGDLTGQLIPKMGDTSDMPQFGWHPSFQHGQGAGGFFHNLGQALIALGLSTHHGQAMQQAIYGSRVKEWEAQHQATAAEVEAAQKQQKLEQEPLPSAAGMVYHPYGTAVQLDRNRIMEEKAQAYTESVHNKLQTALANIDLRKAALGEKTEIDKARVAISQVHNAIAEEGNKIREYGIDANNATRQAVANTLSQLGMDKAHPLAQMIDNIFGTSTEPGAPEAPGGAQPVRGATPIPPRANAPSRPEASKPAARAGAPKVGDTVTIKGKSMKVTAIHPDGTFDAK
jgi:hypothetical protein